MVLVMAIIDNLGLEIWHFSAPHALNLMSIYPQDGVKTLLGEISYLCSLIATNLCLGKMEVYARFHVRRKFHSGAA